MKATLFLGTYEMPRHLELVFAGLQRQTALGLYDYEILVCDDGSGEETRRLIEAFAAKSAVPVKHVWQEHDGFRRCKILNEALRQSSGETVIFLDGDCIPHPEYIRAHIEAQEPGRFCAGRRVDLGPKISARLSVAQVEAGFFDQPRFSVWLSCLLGDSQHFKRSVYVADEAKRERLKMTSIHGLLGCNISIPRQALVDINGFDEAYNGYGREDTDVEYRLEHLGFKIKSMKGLAVQYHVWHPRREIVPANDALLAEVRASGRVRCRSGLVQE